MTDLLTRDPNDSGEIPTGGIYHQTADTAVISRGPGEATQVVRPYDVDFPTLRLPVTDRQAPVVVPATTGVVGEFGPQPTGNPPTLPPEPAPTPPGKSWWQRLTYRGLHRPGPVDAGWPVTIGLVVGLVLIGAGALLAVTW